MSDQIIERGGWYFKVIRSVSGNGFLAWCAKTPNLGHNPLQCDAEIVHFELRPTAEAAITALQKEVLS